jgi:hypothetical protein
MRITEEAPKENIWSLNPQRYRQEEQWGTDHQRQTHSAMYFQVAKIRRTQNWLQLPNEDHKTNQHFRKNPGREGR